MKTKKSPDDTTPDAESFGLTWPVVFSVAGLTLLRSKSVVCQTMGASLMTYSLIRLIKNSPRLPEKSQSGNTVCVLTPVPDVLSPSEARMEANSRQKLNRSFIKGLAAIAEDRINDDAFVLSVCSKAYERLPLNIRRVVKYEWCLRYFQYSKPFILQRLQHHQAEKLIPPALPDRELSPQQSQPPASP